MSSAAPTLSRRLAAYSSRLSLDDVPTEVIDKLKSVLLHDLAVAIAGSLTDESKRALEFARSFGTSGPATVIGAADSVQPMEAAFANAVMMRALRQEDSIVPSFVHPGPLTIPVALAVGERQGCSGREVATALIAGYDVIGKVAGSLWNGEPGYRTPSHVFGAFGSAVVASRLMGHDVEQTATAIAYAGNLAAVITSGFQNHQYGLIARNGLVAAHLGGARAPAPDDALEGQPGFYRAQLHRDVPADVDDQVSSLGVRFEVMTAILKPYPCTAPNMIAVTLLQGLIIEHGLAGSDVATITVHRSRLFGNRAAAKDQGPWESAAHTISSLPFALAAVLLDGEVTPARLHRPSDPEILARSRRIDVEFVPHDELLHNRVIALTGDGREFAAEGGAEVLAAPDPLATLHTLATPVIGRQRVDRLTELVAKLEELESVHEVAACLRGNV